VGTLVRHQVAPTGTPVGLSVVAQADWVSDPRWVGLPAAAEWGQSCGDTSGDGPLKE
jgi:hypothetical protein